jgi:hypothetical protein
MQQFNNSTTIPATKTGMPKERGTREHEPQAVQKED